MLIFTDVVVEYDHLDGFAHGNDVQLGTTGLEQFVGLLYHTPMAISWSNLL